MNHGVKKGNFTLIFTFNCESNAILNPTRQLARYFQSRKTKWAKKKFEISCMTFPQCAVCSKNYVGETQRKFTTRKGEHQKAVAQLQKEKSALADHVIKTNHDIAWNEATILRTNNNWRQRKILEAWEINCAKDPLNRDDGALLPKEYLHLTIAEKKK